MTTMADIERDPEIQSMEVLTLGVPGHRSMRVEYRGGSMWAVVDYGNVLASDGNWVYEPLPSNRTDEFIETTRYPIHEAVRLAKAAAQREMEAGK